MMRTYASQNLKRSGRLFAIISYKTDEYSYSSYSSCKERARKTSTQKITESARIKGKYSNDFRRMLLIFILNILKYSSRAKGIVHPQTNGASYCTYALPTAVLNAQCSMVDAPCSIINARCSMLKLRETPQYK